MKRTTKNIITALLEFLCDDVERKTRTTACLQQINEMIFYVTAHYHPQSYDELFPIMTHLIGIANDLLAGAECRQTMDELTLWLIKQLKE